MTEADKHRYVRPGAVRISAVTSGSSADQYLTVSAFLNRNGFENGDGVVAIQVINNGNLNATFPIDVKGVPGATAGIKTVKTYLLDNSHNLTLVADVVKQTGPSTLSATLGAFSMVAVVLGFS